MIPGELLGQLVHVTPVNDIVKYGGIVYRVFLRTYTQTMQHKVLKKINPKWQVQLDGVEYVTKVHVDEEENETIREVRQADYRYKKNDIVKRGGNLMKCLIGHTSTTGNAGFNTDYAPSKWEVFLPVQNMKMFGLIMYII